MAGFMDVFDVLVTVVAGVLGAVILITTIVKIRTGLPDKWPVIGLMGIGAFLLVGSQYKSFKVSAQGIEALRNEFEEAAAAAEDVAEQVEETVAATEVVETEVERLTNALESRRVVTPELSESIRQRLNLQPAVDLRKLQRARATLSRIGQR